MDTPLPNDFDSYEDRVDMRRDPWTIGAVLLNILITIGSVAWFNGKLDQRMSTAERDITELKVKSSKDSEQDVKIAVIASQLSDISSKIAEVNGKLEARK
jgi:hypothetical protein